MAVVKRKRPAAGKQTRDDLRHSCLRVDAGRPVDGRPATADGEPRRAHPRFDLGTATLPSPLFETEFAAIEATVRATGRGRAFLAEFARRQRADDVARILAALDRIEAHSRQGDVEWARRRLEADRVGEIFSQLADVLKDLRPIADARVRAGMLTSREPAEAPRPRKGGLEHRFAALVQLDEQDLESRFKRLG